MLNDQIKATIIAREHYERPLVRVEGGGEGSPQIAVYVRVSSSLLEGRAVAAISRALAGRYGVAVRRVCRRCWLPPCEGPGAHPTAHPYDELDYTRRMIGQLSDAALEQLLRVWGGAAGNARTAELLRVARARGLGG